jgi:hypothetical protein
MGERLQRLLHQQPGLRAGPLDLALEGAQLLVEAPPNLTHQPHLLVLSAWVSPGCHGDRRKKKLSKAVYGTSHTISLAEAKHLYQKRAARLLIGAGQYGTIELSEEAAAHLERHRCQVELLPTPEVIPAQGSVKVP